MGNEAPIQTPHGGRRPQLAHDARKMIEERLKKYDDPNNEEWDLGDPHIHRWEHHAISIYRDLLAAEAQLAALAAPQPVSEVENQDQGEKETK